jgi:hypothetical protein
MTAHQFFDFFRFIVNTKPVNDGAGGKPADKLLVLME